MSIHCPDCRQVFDNVEDVYKHSSMFHYTEIFYHYFGKNYLLGNGKCSICEEEVSEDSYVGHMGGHHRLIHQFMDKNTLAEYLTLKVTTGDNRKLPFVKTQNESFPVPTFDIYVKSEEEIMDQESATNLENSGEQNLANSNAEQCQGDSQEKDQLTSFSPTQNDDSNTSDSEACLVVQSEPNHELRESSRATHDFEPSGNFAGTAKTVSSKQCPLNGMNSKHDFSKAKLSNPCPLSVKLGTKNTMSSQATRNPKPFKQTSKPSGSLSKAVKSSSLVSIDDKPRIVVKKNQTNRKTQKYKCPECAYSSDHVSSIYTHSATIHYSAQLSNLQKEGFMMNSSKNCVFCPGRSVKNPYKYALHVGGKHKLIHRFIAHDTKLLYDQLPTKKMNCGYNQNKLQKNLKCLICRRQTQFCNITEYKQHLAVIHYREQIKAELQMKCPNHLKNLTCFVCEQTEKAFKKESALITHLGSKHNFIVDFMNEEVKRQLKPFNIVKL